MQPLLKSPRKSIRTHAGVPRQSSAILTLSLLLVVTLFSPARSEIYDQDQVKAVFLYNLPNFITCPAKTGRTKAQAYTIGVIGHDSLMGTLLKNAVSGESTRGRPITVRYFLSLDEIESDPCDLLFINGDQMRLWPQIREIARRHKILTVSDVEGFGHRGGIVSLVNSGRRIHIEINLAEARRNGFEISAKLLKLAYIIPVGKDD